MLREALSYLFDQGRDAKKLRYHKLDGDRPGRSILEKPDGSYEFVHTEPHPRTLTTDNLDHLIAVATNHFDDRVIQTERMAVLYGADSASLIFDTRDSKERLTWSTGTTREYDWFSEATALPEGTMLSVEEAVNLFDIVLRETMPTADFLKKIGKLKIVNEEMQEAARDQTSSLVGGLAKVQVSEETPLPEGEQTFKVRPFTDGLLVQRLPLKVYLRADLNLRRWVFAPVESSWLAFGEAASELIGDRLRAGLDATDIPVIRAGIKQGNS